MSLINLIMVQDQQRRKEKSRRREDERKAAERCNERLVKLMTMVDSIKHQKEKVEEIFRSSKSSDEY